MDEFIENIKYYMDEEDLNFFKSLQKVNIKEAGASLDTCVICYSSQITIFEAPLRCGHRFHAECIKEWLAYQKKCPYCKSDVVDN